MPKPRIAPDPRKKGATMDRGPEKLTRREVKMLDSLAEDWDMAEGDEPNDHMMIERTEDTDYTDIWLYMIERIPDDVRRHVKLAKDAIDRGAYAPGKYRAPMTGLITKRLDMLAGEIDFVDRIVPWVAPQLGIGIDTIERVQEELRSCIRRALAMWECIHEVSRGKCSIQSARDRFGRNGSARSVAGP